MSGGSGGGSGSFVTVDGRCTALCVIGIMGWFSGESDAFHGVRMKQVPNSSESVVSVFVVLTRPSSCFLTV